jgi:hypothetical protein
MLAPVDGLGETDGLCPDCGQQRNLAFTHSIAADSPLAGENALRAGLPERDVIVARSGFERHFFMLDPAESFAR